MSAGDLMNHFVNSVLQSGLRNGLGAMLPIADPDRKWSGADFVLIMQIVCKALDDSFMGLASAKCPAEAPQFGMEVMLLSDTLGDALDRYARLYRLMTNGLSFRLERRDERVDLVIDAPDGGRDPAHWMVEWHTTRLVGISQWLVGYELPDLEVEFAHARQLPLAAYSPAMGAHVSFDKDANRIVFPDAYLARKLVRDIDELNGMMSKKLDLDHWNVRSTWSTLLKSSLRASLQRMEPLPTMEELAHEFGVSSQTLRRGLKSEGTSYRDVKAATRREMVLDNIVDRSMNLGQVSVLAGFAETNSLVRAIKSWTGLSLSTFRQAVIEGELEDGAENVAGSNHG